MTLHFWPQLRFQELPTQKNHEKFRKVKQKQELDHTKRISRNKLNRIEYPRPP